MHIFPIVSTCPRSSTAPVARWTCPDTRRHHPESVGYSRARSGRRSPCGFRQMSEDGPVITASPRLTALTLFWALPTPSRPNSLAATGLSTVCRVLRFPERHTAGTVQCVAFSDCLLSLGHKHFRFPRVFSQPESSFLFTDSLSGWTTLYLSIH